MIGIQELLLNLILVIGLDFKDTNTFVAFWVLTTVLTIILFGPIAKKAGFSRWWALLLAIPYVNFIIIWIFAFVEWPTYKKT